MGKLQKPLLIKVVFFVAAQKGCCYLMAHASSICNLPVLVRAFWEEGKVNEAVEVVRDMERRGVVGIASVYYELACCLCNNGRWQDAIVEVNLFICEYGFGMAGLLGDGVFEPYVIIIAYLITFLFGAFASIY